MSRGVVTLQGKVTPHLDPRVTHSLPLHLWLFESREPIGGAKRLHFFSGSAPGWLEPADLSTGVHVGPDGNLHATSKCGADIPQGEMTVQQYSHYTIIYPSTTEPGEEIFEPEKGTILRTFCDALGIEKVFPSGIIIQFDKKHGGRVMDAITIVKDVVERQWAKEDAAAKAAAAAAALPQSLSPSRDLKVSKRPRWRRLKEVPFAPKGRVSRELKSLLR